MSDAPPAGLPAESLVEVSAGDEPRWLAYLDAESRWWSYLPATERFHHNPGLYQDYFFDQELGYTGIGQQRARRLIDDRVGPTAAVVVRVLGREQTMTVTAVFAAAGR